MDTSIVVVFDRPPQGRKFSTNGPEWAKDGQGHCVVYTKQDAQGVMQQFVARWADGGPQVTQLTRQTLDAYGNAPSHVEDGQPIRVAFMLGFPIYTCEGKWSFLTSPDELHAIPDFNYQKMSMWSYVSPDFLFVSLPAGEGTNQIGRANADTGETTVLTRDAGQKDDPFMFRAPEYGGEILLMANVDNEALGIYRNLGAPDGSWTRIATLTPSGRCPLRVHLLARGHRPGHRPRRGVVLRAPGPRDLRSQQPRQHLGARSGRRPGRPLRPTHRPPGPGGHSLHGPGTRTLRGHT
jgi:hypothetical protein